MSIASTTTNAPPLWWTWRLVCRPTRDARAGKGAVVLITRLRYLIRWWHAFRFHLCTSHPVLRSAQHRSPLRLDRARILVRQRRQFRKSVNPGEWLDGLNDKLRMGGDTALLESDRDARIERRAPSIPDDVNLFGRLAARRHR